MQPTLTASHNGFLRLSSSVKRILTLLLATLCAAVFLGAQGASPAAAAETGIVGNATNPAAIADANALGVTWINRWVSWAELEPNASGSFAGGSIATLDDFVARAAAAHKKLALTVIGTPRWLSGTSDYLNAPSDATAFGNFAGRLAARYAGRVQAWGIWNEADEADFWHGTPPSAVAYAALLKASYKGIKAADPSAQVDAGPLTGNNYEFLEQLYDAGAGGSFDAVDVHTDTACGINSPSSFYYDKDRIGRYSFLGFREVHEVMAAHGDGEKKILMSEMGWSAATSRCTHGAWAGQKDAGVGEEKQAAFLSEAYHCLAGYPYIQAGIWFMGRDPGPNNLDGDRYGLTRWDGTKRASWAAMQQISASGDKQTGPCGDLEPPAITLLEPTSATEFSNSLYVKVSAVDAEGPLKTISFYLNGVQVAITSANNGQVVEKTFDTSKLPLGKTTLKIRVFDAQHNESSQQVVLNKVDLGATSAKKTKFSLSLASAKSVRKLSGRLTVVGSKVVPSGRVVIRWQQFARKSWATGKAQYRWATKYSQAKSAAGPFSISQKIAMRGRWRAVASYDGSGPLGKATAVKNLTIR